MKTMSLLLPFRDSWILSKKEHGFLTQHWIFLCITNCFWNPKKL